MLPTDYSQNTGFREIDIKVIPHNEQRYETPGDYWDDASGVKQIRVSASKPHYEFLITVHEFIEAYLVASKGVNENDITNWDKRFEEMRTKYPEIIGDMEPGDNDGAPYYHEHQMATRVEKWLADSLGINWDEYAKEIDGLRKQPSLPVPSQTTL